MDKYFKLCISLLMIMLTKLAFAQALPPPTADVIDTIKPMLNSERIEYFFGSYGVEPLEVCPDLFIGARVSNLHSFHEGRKVMRTLALVDFASPMHQALELTHESILKGASIGTQLKNDGWTIQKNPVYFGEVALPSSVLSMMDEPALRDASVFIYELVVAKESTGPYHYCNIIEVYSPQYLTKSWLQAIYGDVYQQYQNKTSTVIEIMREVNTCIDSF